jgi:uncharacterized protein YjiK
MTLLISPILTLIISISININHKKVPFNVAKPDKKIELSKELKEISGLTWYKSQLGAVQDEDGILYLLDPNTGAITEKVKFSSPGDFEGVEVIGSEFYILTSSGTLFSFKKDNPKKLNRIETKLSWKNDAEGLAYDPLNNQLLIVCKESGSVGDNKVKGKAIYSLSVDGHKLSKGPIAIIKKSEVAKYAKLEKFKPSGLAVDPITEDIYILASVGNLLVVLNSTYKIKAVQKLPGKIYGQPEGICFSPKGDLFISNEGVDHKPNIYHLRRLPL